MLQGDSGCEGGREREGESVRGTREVREECHCFPESSSEKKKSSQGKNNNKKKIVILKQNFTASVGELSQEFFSRLWP